MAYRNKTYIAFDGEADLYAYRMMQAWRENEHIDFDFHNAHDLNTARDTSQPETIIARLRERLANTKQAILLVGDTTRSKAARETSFLHYEVEAVRRRGLPVVFANLNQSRKVQTLKLPESLASNYYTISVAWQPKIIKYALDEYVAEFQNNLIADAPKIEPYYYKDFVYEGLGL
ncbi:molecular chaperone Tir [Reticulibacter mediterranei]|uniref:Molecular chaperone Tir n=1 Tax=Reticulibacter mediterranei TaxID=2778369 RepID=A0A8J3N4Q6_9CHLR|nr:TIR domain-containing protein [Reticulibacter mediterranei]GHO98467.1 molecular chaperone Tir [Reticulibacter mediterranei]